MKIGLEEAGRIALHRQLYGLRKLQGKTGLRSCIQKLGYLQIDTISVVERAHHHTLYNRINTSNEIIYDKSWLDALLSEDKAIFEHWGHAASYLPIEDFRYSLPRMQRFPDTSSWERKFFDLHKDLMAGILKRIEKEGALGARDFEDRRLEKKDNGWGTSKPEKIALELLLWRGDLMVSNRKNFQRIYDLKERILPSWVDASHPSEEELFEHYILRSLAALGIATLSDISFYFMTGGRDRFQQHLNRLISSGKVLPLEVQDQKDEYYLLAEEAEQTLNPPDRDGSELLLLSPFDNLVINRSRLKRLFGFDYTLECYVTPTKRIYGYWCLPMLYGIQFVGRIDLKADRKSKCLMIQSLHWEKEFQPPNPPRGQGQKAKSSERRARSQELKALSPKELLPALEKALQSFARFCSCDRYQ